MVDDQTPQHHDVRDPAGAGHGWTAVSYLVTGILVWGFGGWLVDRWLETDGIAIAIGTVVGAAGGVYLIARRLGTEQVGRSRRLEQEGKGCTDRP